MSGEDMSNPLGTDWQALEEMSDDEIDYSDIPPLDDGFFARAVVRLPRNGKVSVTVQVDPDVFAWFRSQGQWEQRMQAALKMYVDAHEAQRPVEATE